MLRIKLKPNSPEYEDRNAPEQTKTQECEMPGCAADGHHKAPKHRGLNEYYMFCADHIREYNKAWDFFDGMSETEMQDHILKSRYGFRPTWNYGSDGDPEDILRDQARKEYHFGEKPKQEDPRRNRFSQDERKTPEVEAMALMGLEPPVTLEVIKRRYKELAKKHHPDLNQGCPKSEELLKQINMAYTILKLAYQDYEELQER